MNIDKLPWLYFDNSILLVFTVDYFTRLFISKNKWTFFKQNIFDLLAILPFYSAFSFFRFARIMRIMRFARAFRFVRLIGFIGKAQRYLHDLLKTNGFIHWLLEHHVSFQERDMSRRPLNASEIKLLLSLTENGCWDLVSTRCKVFKKLNVDIESLTLSQFIQLLTKHPEMIKRPIIFDRNTLQVGFNEDEIRSFLPRRKSSDK
uniref:transcriptional regulator Spx n=1 Tax=Lentilactobacillus hilgardii TaxID=1588 RepID=UPI00403F8D11